MTTRRKKVTEFSDNGVDATHWHLNKGIPIIWLVGSLAIGTAQFGGLVWYASQFNTRVDIVEKTISMMAPQGERLTRVEEKLVAVQASTNRIEALLTPVKVR
jgi:hypothetical protein